LKRKYTVVEEGARGSIINRACIILPFTREGHVAEAKLNNTESLSLGGGWLCASTFLEKLSFAPKKYFPMLPRSPKSLHVPKKPSIPYLQAIWWNMAEYKC
jgi:hypothetical protein